MKQILSLRLDVPSVQLGSSDDSSSPLRTAHVVRSPRRSRVQIEPIIAYSSKATSPDHWERVQSDEESMGDRLLCRSPRLWCKSRSSLKQWRSVKTLDLNSWTPSSMRGLSENKTSHRMREPLIRRATSRYSITAGQCAALRSQQRCVFLPSSPFLKIWDMIMFLFLIATGIFEPYVFVFKIDTYASELFYWFSSLVYMADTGLRFLRAQRKSTRDGVVLVESWREIASMCVVDWMFWIDFISALPVPLVVMANGYQRTDTGRLLNGVRMIRLLKFARLPHLLHRLHEICGWAFSSLSVIQFGMMSCLVLHWIACLWAALGSIEEESWLRRASNEYEFMEFVDNRDMYLMSLYWSVTVLSSVGFGDVTPRARGEFFWAIVSMVIGGTVWAYVVGCICSMGQGIDKDRTAFENQMNDVNNMCAERHFPTVLRDRVQNFYQHAKEFMRMQNYHKTIRELSPALKGEVFNWMYGSCFQRVWYFDVVDERCARLLTEGMVPKMYAPEEVIEDTVDGCVRCLVFLRSGLCVRKKNILAPGAHWGLDVILGSEEHHDIEELLDTSQASSLNFVFVLKLGKNTIDHAATLVPVFKRRLRKAHLRMLFWRGAIAASRATKRLQRPETEIQHSETPAWDKAGRMMAKVVHLDRLLVEAEELGCASAEVNAVMRRSSCQMYTGRGVGFLASVKQSQGGTQRHGLSPLLQKTQRHRSSPDFDQLIKESTAPRRNQVNVTSLRNRPSGTRLPKKKPVDLPILSDGDVAVIQRASSNDEYSSCDVSHHKGSERQLSKSTDANTELGANGARRRSLSDCVGTQLNLSSEDSPTLSVNSIHLPLEHGLPASNALVAWKARMKSPRSDDVGSSVGRCRSLTAESDDIKSLEALPPLRRSTSEESASVQGQLADIREEIAESRRDMEEEIGSLREDVANLTRLMNQLLERFHAQEPY